MISVAPRKQPSPVYQNVLDARTDCGRYREEWATYGPKLSAQAADCVIVNISADAWKCPKALAGTKAGVVACLTRTKAATANSNPESTMTNTPKRWISS